MYKNLILITSILSMCLLTGCTTRLGDFTLLSSKNVNLANFSNSEAEESGEQAIGSDESHIICIFPTGYPNLKEAVDEALEESNAYMLTNARLDFFHCYIPYIYGNLKYIAKGTPVKNQ